MRGRLFVISEAGSDGTNTSQTATYKCLVSGCVRLPGSSPVITPPHHQTSQTSQNARFLPWPLSVRVSESNFPRFDASQSFTISVYWRMIDDGTDLFSISDIWGRQSHEIKCFIVENNFYFVSAEWRENFKACFYQLQEAKLVIDSTESVIDILSIFISLKHFPHCILQQVPLTSDVSRENQIIKTIFYYTNPRV